MKENGDLLVAPFDIVDAYSVVEYVMLWISDFLLEKVGARNYFRGPALVTSLANPSLLGSIGAGPAAIDFFELLSYPAHSASKVKHRCPISIATMTTLELESVPFSSS